MKVTEEVKDNYLALKFNIKVLPKLKLTKAEKGKITSAVVGLINKNKNEKRGINAVPKR